MLSSKPDCIIPKQPEHLHLLAASPLFPHLYPEIIAARFCGNSLLWSCISVCGFLWFLVFSVTLLPCQPLLTEKSLSPEEGNAFDFIGPHSCHLCCFGKVLQFFYTHNHVPEQPSNHSSLGTIHRGSSSRWLNGFKCWIKLLPWQIPAKQLHLLSCCMVKGS